jgi:hypothetical protein
MSDDIISFWLLRKYKSNSVQYLVVSHQLLIDFWENTRGKLLQHGTARHRTSSPTVPCSPDSLTVWHIWKDAQCLELHLQPHHRHAGSPISLPTRKICWSCNTRRLCKHSHRAQLVTLSSVFVAFDLWLWLPCANQAFFFVFFSVSNCKLFWFILNA